MSRCRPAHGLLGYDAFLTALPITSDGRFWPCGPLSMIASSFTQAVEHRLLAAPVKHPCVSLEGGTAGVRLCAR
jgi:hypothetical protein